jgi:hypothetical protein
MVQSGPAYGHDEKTQNAENPIDEERKGIERKESKVTVDSNESFPASDPPRFNLSTTGAADGEKKK